MTFEPNARNKRNIADVSGEQANAFSRIFIRMHLDGKAELAGQSPILLVLAWHLSWPHT